ncbi:response regulator [Flavobacterium psychrophilum]|jgi:CheY-like chemotaxis protein|uniref:Response regulator n=2 Tax=Flavobacterium psychrophilum TaxID=96345 RepID=A0A075SCE3_FLAPS|nr:response regulator [Flavobacterium psychrophilum]AIG29825.1 transcriptional regulator [Flavobacterium psychrophilum]AIG32102.1 transcriptional regulator [Flavobacterium psychrophilum]AIG34257.1 transcriptional regulator [Flavobacterium psychrophilum]AIG36620.1 transcriptional regulator [Flavobacterium psychrophilum]AIG38885.1 transcriptional regulator [Flavobacterium psychrophilum]
MAKSLNILLIEDDTIEIMKFNRVLKTIESNHKIIEANNGEEALEILKEKENTPDIIILDLNMPRINGIEFLGILKQDPVLKYIPAIILTTSNNHTDILECYKIGIAGYVLKPLKYDDYVDRIKKMLDYWSINELISQ